MTSILLCIWTYLSDLFIGLDNRIYLTILPTHKYLKVLWSEVYWISCSVILFCCPMHPLYRFFVVSSIFEMFLEFCLSVLRIHNPINSFKWGDILLILSSFLLYNLILDHLSFFCFMNYFFYLLAFVINVYHFSFIPHNINF